MKKIFLLATLLYFLIAPVTYHPDTKLTLRYPALENNKIWDIYSYLNKYKLNIPDFHYPPAHYWWLKIHYPISKILGGEGFDNWLQSNSAEAAFNSRIFTYSLAAKFPLLLLGLFSGLLIYKIVFKNSKDDNKSKLAAIIWYFNPITIYSIVLMGQNDIVAIFLFLAGVYFIEKWLITVLLFGLAAGVKSYPIIWSIIYWLAIEKKLFRLFIKVGLTLLIYGLILAPWITKPYFIYSVMNSGLSQRMFDAGIAIGYDKIIKLIPLLLVIIAIKAIKSKSNHIYKIMFLIFLSSGVILGFSHFNPQWMLWVIPFLSIWLPFAYKKNEIWYSLLGIFGAWLILTIFIEDRFLIWGIFTPINPNLINYPTLPEYLRNKGIDFGNIVNLSQTILAGIMVWYLVNKIKLKKHKINLIDINKKIVFVPWIMLVLITLLISFVKVDNKIMPQKTDTKIDLGQIENIEYIYQTNNNLRYLEILLNNPGMVSTDHAIARVANDSGDFVDKEFSGFNAGDNNWIRIDLNDSFKSTKFISFKILNIIKNDGKLKITLDENEKVAINLFYHSFPDIKTLGNKFWSFWWWWIICAGISFYFVKICKNKF